MEMDKVCPKSNISCKIFAGTLISIRIVISTTLGIYGHVLLGMQEEAMKKWGIFRANNSNSCQFGCLWLLTRLDQCCQLL